MADEILDLGTDTSIELESPEVETEVESAEPGTETESTEVQPTGELTKAADIWKQAKELLKEHPELHRQVKKALHMMEDANRRFPDGITKAQERLELISQLDDNPEDPEYVPGSKPMEQVVSDTLAERGFWRDFDNAYQASDPRVINHMVEANPVAFQNLVPQAFERYRSINEQGYSTMICKPMAAYMEEQEIPLQLALLARVLPPESNDPGLQTVIEAFGRIRKVFGDIQAQARKPIEVQNGETASNAAENATGTDTEIIQARHDAWLPEIRSKSENFTVSEIQRMFPKTRFTPTELASIKSAVSAEVGSRVRINDAYQRKISGFLKAKNKTGYLMTVESEHKKIIGGASGAAKRAVDDVLAKRKAGYGKKSVAAAQNGNGHVKPNGAAVDNGNQYEWISDSPTRLGLKVDFRRGGIKPDNTAYVVGRSKPVKWKKK